MKVRELIEKLKEFDPELIVFYSDHEHGDFEIEKLDYRYAHLDPSDKRTPGIKVL